MTTRKTIRPINSMVFIHDATQFDVPDLEADKPVTSTAKCVQMLTYPECGGRTDVTFGPLTGAEPSFPLYHDALLETPSRTVVMSTVDEQLLFSVPVPDPMTRVRIWLNRPWQPDEVVVGLG